MSKHKLDMFRQVLPNLDRHNLDYYSGLSEEEQKGFAGIVAMRWMSCASGQYADWFLIATNQRANVHFYEMHKHPELQWKLLASNGLGAQVRHAWVGNAKKPSNVLLNEFISRFWPSANKMEIETILGQYDKESFSYFVDGAGVDTEEGKRLKQSFQARGL